jgi:hypothetical protein
MYATTYNNNYYYYYYHHPQFFEHDKIFKEKIVLLIPWLQNIKKFIFASSLNPPLPFVLHFENYFLSTFI